MSNKTEIVTTIRRKGYDEEAISAILNILLNLTYVECYGILKIVETRLIEEQYNGEEN